jgi:hypothetical protein
MSVRDVCPSCGEALPDPALIADAARRHMILPAHEEMHMCPGPVSLLRVAS